MIHCSHHCPLASTVFRRLRIAALLYVLVLIAGTEFFTARRATDGNAPLRVDVYVVAGDAAPVTRRFVDGLTATEFADAEAFLAREARRYGVGLEQPFKLRIVGEHSGPPPLAHDAGPIDVLWWSLSTRWLAASLRRHADGPSADIIAFAVFHEPSAGSALDRSTALDKGLVAVAHLFAAPEARATNQIVLAHELLHTLRATDKYSLATNAPTYPDGYADPHARPLLPQTRAELMTGRIPVDERRAEMPRSLRDVVIGPATAREIGWQ
jgi:hypothetical protein